jgi:hypothetical protein
MVLLDFTVVFGKNMSLNTHNMWYCPKTNAQYMADFTFNRRKFRFFDTPLKNPWFSATSNDWNPKRTVIYRPAKPNPEPQRPVARPPQFWARIRRIFMLITCPETVVLLPFPLPFSMKERESTTIPKNP